MNEIDFRFDTIFFKSVTQDDLKDVQGILDHASYYHSTIVKYPSKGIAERCFHAPLPEAPGSRVFKRFFLIEDKSVLPGPLATLDMYVGFPNYKIASIAMLIIREEAQRKGLGSHILTAGIPAFLREHHPAVESIRVTVTDNNVPALRCLVKCKYEYANAWEKLDVMGRPVTAVSYGYRFKLS